jgi:uncharacterized protein (DUF2164 family)
VAPVVLETRRGRVHTLGAMANAKQGLTRDERERAVARIRAYFREERDEEIADLAAGLLLDFVERELGYVFFNQGARAARAVAARSHARLDEDLDGLERSPPR